MENCGTILIQNSVVPVTNSWISPTLLDQKSIRIDRKLLTLGSLDSNPMWQPSNSTMQMRKICSNLCYNS
ncbi:unnamed protein product [Macrosiphum euphorbiae]|uniref:Uncharacterized protein n=1 Tax=Macrosiphum euphorbiae TaxID=13131 RepID=A0AAV0WF93_9HEMI|nr:unnamed protein product [Macrosiphum euphorbiae]